MIPDEWGEPVAASNPASVDAWNRAWNTALHFKGDPFADLAAANTDDAEFALGQVFCAAYLVLSGAPPDTPELVSALATARERAGDFDRERGHTDAVELLAAGEFTAAARTWDRVAEATRDLAAVRFAHDVYLHVGDNGGRLASSTVALSNWSPSDPGYGFVLGQHAFSLEETGKLEEAEAAGWSALEQDPEDIWALHALAHVFETSNDQRASLELLQSRQEMWAQHDSLAVHLWWHLALRLIIGGRTDQALAIHDRLLADATTAFRLCDLASLLWRLEVSGVDVGDRWLPLADRWAGRRERHTCAFLDLHAALVFLRVPQHPGAARFLAGLGHAHQEDTSENGAIFRDVLRPLLDAFRATASGQAAIGGTLFRRVADATHRIGGSNAQRELITMTEQSLSCRSSD